MLSRFWKSALLFNRVRCSINPTALLTAHSQLLLRPKFNFSQEPNKHPKPTGKIDSEGQSQMKPIEGLENGKQNKNVKQEDDAQAMQPTKFGNTMLMVSAISLLLAYAFMEIQVVRANNKKKKSESAVARVTGVGKAHIGGDWQLVDTKGNNFGSKELAGTYYLIYFGFTHCPDICPNSLTKISRAVARVKNSKEANFFNLKIVFVSVDPDRDTPQKIQKFMKLFDPEMIGVTAKSNNDQTLRECMRKFKIYASKLQFQDPDSIVKGRKSYTIDHTILTYLMSDTNDYLTHLGANLGEHDLTNIILQKIKEDKRQKMKQMKM